MNNLLLNIPFVSVDVWSMKRCPDCGLTKPKNSFWSNKAMADGRAFYCIPCSRERAGQSREPVRLEHRDEEKWCSDCGEFRPKDEFGKNRSSSDGLTSYCRPHHNARGRTNRDSRRYHLKRRYNISPEEVDALIEAQGGLCAVCLSREAKQVDHDHKTGRVRGVLCHHCNTALGNLFDDPEILERAVEYLKGGE